MKHTFREHYGQKFCLNTDILPAQSTDRFSPLILLLGFIFGLLFFLSGFYLLVNGAVVGTTDLDAIASTSTIKPYTLVSTETFGVILIVLGTGLILASTFFDLRFKVIRFDGTNIFVQDFPLLGRAHTFEEKISHYKGVRLRLKFCQYGIFTKNKFIIELYHEDASKIVPLYISTSPKKVRDLWRKYAVEFCLPPIHISDKGMVSHSVQDMEKSYVDVVKSWHLPPNFLSNKTHSQDFIVKQKKDKKMIKMRHVMYDFYSNLNVAVIVLMGALFCYATYSHDVLMLYLPTYLIVAFYSVLIALVIYAYINLTVRDVLLIHNGKIIVFRKILGISYQDVIIPFVKLKGIDISYTPTTDRYAINLLTDKNVVIVFNKLHVDDLRWIRGFLVGEITQ